LAGKLKKNEESPELAAETNVEKPRSGKPGGLNRSLQHSLQVYRVEFHELKSFPRVDPNKTVGAPALGSCEILDGEIQLG
jgi:hypothetical protein